MSQPKGDIDFVPPPVRSKHAGELQPKGDVGFVPPTGRQVSGEKGSHDGCSDAQSQTMSDAETGVGSSCSPSDTESDSAPSESGHEEEYSSLGTICCALNDTACAQQCDPNFSGRWLLHHYEGNFEAMLEESSVPWATRKFAKAGNYGVGIMTQQIRHEGLHMSVEFKAGPSGGHQAFVIGDGEQETADEKGDRILMTPSWDGQTLVVESVRAKTRKRDLTSMRYLQGDEMVVEVYLSNGSSVKRFFRRHA